MLGELRSALTFGKTVNRLNPISVVSSPRIVPRVEELVIGALGGIRRPAFAVAALVGEPQQLPGKSIAPHNHHGLGDGTINLTGFGRQPFSKALSVLMIRSIFCAPSLASLSTFADALHHFTPSSGLMRLQYGFSPLHSSGTRREISNCAIRQRSFHARYCL